MKLSHDRVKKTCKPGTKECCSYLTMGAGGWECGKLSPSIKVTIDQQRIAGTINAANNGCSGPPYFKPVSLN